MSSRIFSLKIAFVAACTLLAAFGGSLARADRREDCLRLFADLKTVKTQVRKTLVDTAGWPEIVTGLETGVTPHSRQPYALRFLPNRGQRRIFVPVASDFEHAELSVARRPRFPVPPGGKVVRGVNFGYDLPNEYRRIGTLEFIVTDAEGKIVEVGAASEAMMTEFLRHLHGVTLTPRELARISELNERLLAALRNDPACRKKLAEFAAARKWPPGLAEEGRLAYFDPSLFDVRAWATKNGYSMAELVDAGWYRLSFDRAGKPGYVLNAPDSIKIPYLAADGKAVPVWRSRNLSKTNPNLPKYTGWQIDRSVNRRLAVSERLYNGAKLARVKGKPIIITEGEFKCLVTEKLTGIPTFGIPGITEFDDEMVKALVDAEASEYVVILDRDPHGKALFRADEVTDSNRAAYSLAKDLERLGAKNVRVGTLPELKGGEKLGIDDLAIQYGVDPIRNTVSDAVSADAYAVSIGLDPGFQEVIRRRSRLKQAIARREAHLGRNGVPKGDDPLLKKANDAYRALDRTFHSYLENELNGARTLGSASGKVNSIRPAYGVPNAGKTVGLREGKSVRPEAFDGDLLLLDYVPADLEIGACRPGPCGQVPFSSGELAAAFAGESPSGSLSAALEMTDGLARETGYAPKTAQDFAVLALAGELTHSFPVDEYRYEFSVRLSGGPDAARVTLPLVIFKRKSGKAVALANLHVPASSAYWDLTARNFESTLAFLRGKKP